MKTKNAELISDQIFVFSSIPSLPFCVQMLLVLVLKSCFSMTTVSMMYDQDCRIVTCEIYQRHSVIYQPYS